MMSTPLVSIVTASYNQGRFIEDTLRSIKEQDYPSLEHLVIDGASTDNTIDILRRYEGTYNMRWISEPDRNHADALCKGFRLAKGEILAWLNSDDVYLPGAVRSAVEAFRRAPGMDLVYGDVILINGDGDEIGRRKLTVLDWYDFLGQGNCLAQPASFWTRRIYDRVGGIDATLYFQMDLDFYIRVVQAGQMRHLRRYLAKIRMHPEGKMVKAEHIRQRELIVLQQRYLPPGVLQHPAYGRPWLLTRQFVRYTLQGDLDYASRRIWDRLRRMGSA